jgi:hypothetical protein
VAAQHAVVLVPVDEADSEVTADDTMLAPFSETCQWPM